MTTAPAAHRSAIAQADAGDAATRDNQFVRLALDHAEIGGLADGCLHRSRIELAVGLGPRAAHRRTLATVEHAELDPGGIRDMPHQAIQRIDLADQMALAETPDRGIAGHRADGRKAMGHQRRPGAHACRRTRRLTAGVAAADDDDIE